MYSYTSAHPPTQLNALRMLIAGVSASLLMVIAAFPSSALAAPSPVITFTFDDANQSQYEIPAAIMKQTGQVGTLYVPTGSVNTPGYVTWAQLLDLQSRGWDPSSHTVTHPELPTLTNAGQRQEIVNSFNTLTTRNLSPTSLATPFGAYSTYTLAEIAKKYAAHRGFHEVGYNRWPYNKYYLHVQRITNTTTVDEVKSWIDTATANNYWLIIAFHEVLPTVDPQDQYSWSTAQFTELMSYLNDRNITLKTVEQVIAVESSLIPGSSFENVGDFGTLWRTDNPARVSLNTGTKGSYPLPKNSIMFRGGATTTAHLFSPLTPVSSGDTYGIRMFANTAALTAGELGVYVDEYDANKAWVSGKWMGQAGLQFVIDESYQYKPTSSAVAFASVQVYLTKGAQGTAFVDNINLFKE